MPKPLKFNRVAVSKILAVSDIVSGPNIKIGFCVSPWILV